MTWVSHHKVCGWWRGFKIVWKTLIPGFLLSRKVFETTIHSQQSTIKPVSASEVVLKQGKSFHHSVFIYYVARASLHRYNIFPFFFVPSHVSQNFHIPLHGVCIHVTHCSLEAVKKCGSNCPSIAVGGPPPMWDRVTGLIMLINQKLTMLPQSYVTLWLCDHQPWQTHWHSWKNNNRFCQWMSGFSGTGQRLDTILGLDISGAKSDIQF